MVVEQGRGTLVSVVLGRQTSVVQEMLESAITSKKFGLPPKRMCIKDSISGILESLEGTRMYIVS